MSEKQDKDFWKAALEDEFLDVGPAQIIAFVRKLCKDAPVDRLINNPHDQTEIRAELAHYDLQLLRITPYRGASYFD